MPGKFIPPGKHMASLFLAFLSYHMLSLTPSCSTCVVFDWFLVRFAAWAFGSLTMSETGDCGCVVHIPE